MVDTILRGSGLAGAVATTTKNTVRKFLQQEEKGFTADHAYTLIEAANISPPIGSKLRKSYTVPYKHGNSTKTLLKNEGLTLL